MTAVIFALVSAAVLLIVSARAVLPAPRPWCGGYTGRHTAAYLVGREVTVRVAARPTAEAVTA